MRLLAIDYEVVSAIHRPAKQIGNDGKTHHPAGNNKQGELTDDIGKSSSRNSTRRITSAHAR